MNIDEMYTNIMIEFERLHARLDKIEVKVDKPLQTICMSPDVMIGAELPAIKSFKSILGENREHARKLFADIVPADVMGIGSTGTPPGVDKLN